METQAKHESDQERLQRMPKVLRAYVRPIEDGRIPDSGLPDVLTFVANQLERLLAHDYDAAYREWAAKMNQLESENERLKLVVVAQLIDIDSDLDEVRCSACGVIFSLSWRRDPTVDRAEYCPFCGEDITQ